MADDGGAVLEPIIGEAGMLDNQLLGLDDITSTRIIYRGGYRSGKTVFLIAKAIDLGWRHWPHPVLAVMPSYTMIQSVFVEEAYKVCGKWGLRCKYNVSRKVLTIGREGRYPVRILCRSADKPRSLEGLTVGSLVGDEWELWPIQSLTVAIARVSAGECQQRVFGGTPEGYGPAYELLEKNPAPGTRIIVSRTVDNPHVMDANPNYAADVRSLLSEAEGVEKTEGIRMAPEGRAFTRFDRAVHCASAAVEDDGHIEVWAGFNAAKMVWAIVLVSEDGSAFHVFGELVRKHTESQSMAEMAVEQLADWRTKNGNHTSVKALRALSITALCDADGQERGKRAARSHIENMSEAGFNTRYPKKNPDVEDRVASIQKVLFEQRLSFDEEAAPYFTRCIAQLRKGKDGKPERDGDLEHGAHVIGNGVMWHSPATRPATAFVEQRAKRSWDEARKAGSDTPGTPPHMLRALPGLLRNRMAQMKGKPNGNAVKDLGCTIVDFARYIESQFVEGMTWANHGRHGWQLDHKRPLSSYDLENREHFLAAAHFTNYQPLWSKDNKEKGSKWNGGLAPEERRS